MPDGLIGVARKLGAARNSPPGAGPPGRCHGRRRARYAIRPARPSAARPCAAWNSACTGISSSLSPCTSSTGGRAVISAAKCSGSTSSGSHQHAGIADDRRRRDRAAQADMQRHHGALAEKPTSASADGGSLWRASSASRNASSTGAAWLTPTQRSFGSRKVSGNHSPPDRRLAAGLRRVRRDERGVAAAAAARRGRSRSGRCRRRHSRAGTRQAACAAPERGVEPRTVELSHWPFVSFAFRLLGSLLCLPAGPARTSRLFTA